MIRGFSADEWAAYQSHREEIADLIDPRCYSMDWIDSLVTTGAAQVFANDEAVILTEIKNYPTGALEIHGLVAAGELAAILDLIEQAEAWGRSVGCQFASIASREGWGRVLAGRGYQPYQMQIRKEL